MTVIWTIGIFFSTIAPIIPCICGVYFFFKYWIDKYNLMYVYPTEYDTMYPFSESAVFMCTLAIFGFQIFMFVLFTFTFGEDFFISAIVLLCIELLGQIFQRQDFTKLYSKFREPDLVDDMEMA